MRERLAGDEASEIAGCELRQAMQHGGGAEGGDMRRDDEIGTSPQWVFRRQRLRLRDIETGAGDLAAAQRGAERHRIDDTATRDVDQDGIAPAGGKLRRADE